MTAIRRYIKTPYWNNGIDFINTIKVFIHDLEKLCVDAGLVKSNMVGNLDIDSFDLTTWYNTNKYKNGDSTIPSLYFDLNDSMQTLLPVTLKFDFGINRYSASASYPSWVILNASVLCGGSEHIIQSPISYNTGVGYNIFDNEYDSFITVIDGFVSVNICNGTSQSANMGNNYTYSLPLCSFQLERSFNDIGVYTGENINVFASPSNTVHSADFPMVNAVITKSGIYIDTSTLIYIQRKQSTFTNGKLLVNAVYHIFNDSSIKPSPNILAVNNSAVMAGSEVSIQVDDKPVANFIGINCGNEPSSVTRMVAHNRYSSSSACKLIVRFE